MEKPNFLSLKEPDLKHIKIVISKEQIFRDLGDETVILHTGKGIYCGLNQVGANVWAHIKEPANIQEILEILMKEYDVKPEQCRLELLKLLQQLSDNDLIDVINEKNI